MNILDEINIRNARPSDHENVVSVMPDWWGGRDLSSSVLKVFFIHFNKTTYVAEIKDDLVGFLVGFLSQSEENAGYIHFAGVHPHYREAGIGRLLFQRFYGVCKSNRRSIVRSCTSPINKLSINFHQRMGFIIEPGDGIVDGVPVTLNYLRKNDPKVLFRKELDR
ncbi:MAG: GNAT family N-acetyltransferase [Desulfosporosinus sp.]|nr:GNAT family N-acetyltransferase [Desulfosporosinus sp.]